MTDRADILLLLLLALAAGCQRPPATIEAPCPEALVGKLLDAAPKDALAAIQDTFPGSEVASTSFVRVKIAQSRWIDEVVLFSNLHSGRVDAVILKYKPTLEPAERRRAIEACGEAAVAEALASGQPSATGRWRGLTLRATAADRQGRLTLTFEPPPAPEAAPLTAPPRR